MLKKHIERNQYVTKTIAGGVSGNTGIITIGKDKYFYKISKRVDFTLEHEYEVMKELSIYEYTGHIIRVISLESITNCLPYKYINTLSRKYLMSDSFMTDPFKCYDKKKYKTNVLFTEYIEDSVTFEKMIQSSNDNDIIACLLQIYCILTYLGDIRYNHYDLHTENVLVVRCKLQTRRYEINGKRIDITSNYVVKLIDQELARTYIDDDSHITYKTNGMRELHIARTYDDLLDYYHIMNRTLSSLKKSNRHELYSKLLAFKNDMFGEVDLHMKPKEFPSYLEVLKRKTTSDLFNMYFKEICILSLALSKTKDKIREYDIDVIERMSTLIDSIDSRSNLDMLLQYKKLLQRPTREMYEFSQIVHEYMEANFHEVYDYVQEFKRVNFKILDGESLTYVLYCEFTRRKSTRNIITITRIIKNDYQS